MALPVSGRSHRIESECIIILAHPNFHSSNVPTRGIVLEWLY